MTKADIAQFVADKLQKSDAGSLVLLKSFVDRRYDMIWNSGLWRETLGTTSYSVAVDENEVTLNSTVHFPVSAAWDNNEIAPTNLDTVFRIDPELLSQSGTPIQFLVLPNSTEEDTLGQAVIQLIKKPDTAKTLLVLGKLKVVALDDLDSPKINGIDNALLAFVEADMLQHLRQYGKAQVMQQEASAQLAVCRDLETSQSAKISKLVPEMTGVWDIGDFE